MRTILFLILLFALSTFTCVNAQTILQIDSLIYTVRSAQSDNERMPLSETDPNYKEPEADLSIVFYINDTLQLNSLELIFSTSNGNGDFKKMKRDLNTKEEKDILFLKNEVRFINGNKILIRCTVPFSIFKKRIYLTIKAIDNNGGESNLLSKIFN